MDLIRIEISKIYTKSKSSNLLQKMTPEMITAFAALLAVAAGVYYQRETLKTSLKLDRSKHLNDRALQWEAELRKELAEFCILVFDNTGRHEVSRYKEQPYPRNQEDQDVQYNVEKSYHRLLLLLADTEDTSCIKSSIQRLRECKTSEWMDCRNCLLLTASELIKSKQLKALGEKLQ